MKASLPNPSPEYQDLGELGAGGMGEVRRARDKLLRRDVAIKLLRTEFVADPSLLARFVQEARITARLEHPGIVPVHALGSTEDGRPYFAMKEVKGVTLTTLISELHRVSIDGRWGTTSSGWSFPGLIQAFHRVCEAVAFAHSRKVVHRDLKPDNIMLGAFGEVLVLDWGLAKMLDGSDSTGDLGRHDGTPTGDAHATTMGAVVGTPSYMPPEQARGQATGLTADVYALGAILYEILAGVPPFDADTVEEVLDMVRKHPPKPLPRVVRSSSPPELGKKPNPPEHLVDLCERAMARNPADRYAEAGELAAGVQAYLEGARDQAKAVALVREAEEQQARIKALAERARVAREQAAAQASQVPGHTPVDGKRGIWDLEDEAEELAQQAALEDVRRVQLLRAALSLDPELPEANARLADHYRLRMASAEASGDALEFWRAERQLRAHDNGQHADWLRGDGLLTLYTDPPGAAVEVYRCVERDRRLSLQLVRSPGRAPMRAWNLAMGSYLVIIKKEGYVPTRYPVRIGRQAHWDGVPPGEAASRPVRLLRNEQLGPDDCYVPAGWFQSGGDKDATGGLPRKNVWLDDFVIKRYPITNRQWIEFLNALVAEGKEELALRYAPRERPAVVGALGDLVYGRSLDGTFRLRSDVRPAWQADWPVMMIDWHSATAYAQWESARTGLAWRLPWELEREKAGRGVDGRPFPWGDHLDPTFANMCESHADGPTPSLVTAFPVDESLYGARGMAGNVRDWCKDAYRQEGPTIVDGRFLPRASGGSNRAVRGGAFAAYRRSASTAFRLGDAPESRALYVGARLCRSID